MTDREQHSLRGPAKTVVCETFEWDEKAGAIPGKPSRREDLSLTTNDYRAPAVPRRK
jgi:hypothetical protein